ncbi:4Fe-4S dicluster domain-containing protein [bacterium]|nr:4Fe-4S dicluster domain-containing protein [bacterium]
MTAPDEKKPTAPDRREFLARCGQVALGGLFVIKCTPALADLVASDGADDIPEWAYAVDTTKCIGCGACMRACRAENNVPESQFRTWVERYEIRGDHAVRIDIASDENNATFLSNATPAAEAKDGRVKAFFVPKLCNHCETSVCVQVCPVGATFRTKDGVVLVDPEHCVGCGYCVQACPYSTRFINKETHTADKCTLCYHRITKGLLPACVQSCPVGARIFGNVKDPDSEISRVLRERRYTLLKPELGTNPRCYYIGLDMEVV